VAILAKPFCIEDLDTAAAWLRDSLSAAPFGGAPIATLVQRRRLRAVRRRAPAR
jgi:hypothetical protein